MQLFQLGWSVNRDTWCRQRLMTTLETTHCDMFLMLKASRSRQVARPARVYRVYCFGEYRSKIFFGPTRQRCQKIMNLGLKMVQIVKQYFFAPAALNHEKNAPVARFFIYISVFFYNSRSYTLGVTICQPSGEWTDLTFR